MTTTDDPMAPLWQRTPEQVAEYLDDHLVMALEAADMIHPGDRQLAEDYVRDRLVAVSDTWITPSDLTVESRRRKNARVLKLLGQAVSR